MGEIIRKTASVEDILADARHALAFAATKGGVWKTAADQSLAPAVALFDAVDAKRAVLENAVGPLVATLRYQDEVADAAIGRISDAVWTFHGWKSPRERPKPDLPGRTSLLPWRVSAPYREAVRPASAEPKTSHPASPTFPRESGHLPWTQDAQRARKPQPPPLQFPKTAAFALLPPPKLTETRRHAAGRESW